MTKHLPEDVRRNQILEAARRCFIERGYFPTRMEDIARAAGLSKGGLYFHFDSKRQVFEALVRQEYEESSGFLQSLSAGAASFEGLLTDLARHYLEFFRSRPDYPRFFMVMGEMAGRDESVRQMLASLQGEYIEALARVIRGGIERGALKPVSPEATATMLKGIVDALEGYIALGVPLDTEQLLAAGIEIVLHGLLRRGEERA